ncbi:MAG TPA: glycosyltransferase family 2 protein [Bacilli bacterium]|jgi:glycosyltransferase involved in cell wall biosynthesis|nr:glycosyltransferase family 2 protein [Bacilli bacterium]
MEINVIIPTYNEEGNIQTLYKSLTDNLSTIKYTLTFVDDGSNDSTLDILTSIYNKDKKHIKVISFSRNFGKDQAIYAGMSTNHSKYVSIIDADMQQNPKYIMDMYKYLEENKDYDEVAMVNVYDKDSLIQKQAKKTFYSIMKNMTKQNYEAGASDFRLLKKEVVDSILKLQETNRFTKGIFSWVGFKIHYIKYTPEKRLSGTSKFKFKKQFSYALDAILNFSTIPLRISSIIGGTISLVSFIYFIVLLIKTLIMGKDIPGYASLMCILLLLGGLILFVLGIIGEYVSRTYIEIKKRPIYIAKTTLGFDEDIL